MLNLFCVCAVRGKNELVVCFGELLIDFVPTVGGVSLADAPAFKKAPGGAPANVAVGVAKLGGNAAFVGKVLRHSHTKNFWNSQSVRKFSMLRSFF